MGAWEFGYPRNPTRAVNDRHGMQLVRLKAELVYNGFGVDGENIIVGNYVYGEGASNRCKEFQASVGLSPTGVITPTDARVLFKKRIQIAENMFGLPRNSLYKKISLESLFDPVAVGSVDSDDRGICQINTRIHNVSVDQANNPAFAINWAAAYMNQLYNGVASRANLWKAARVAYNVGEFYAYMWMINSFPASGMLVGGIDWYARATNYWNAVEKQQV